MGRMIQITGVRNRREGLYKNPKLRVTNPQSYRMLGDQKHYMLKAVITHKYYPLTPHGHSHLAKGFAMSGLR